VINNTCYIPETHHILFPINISEKNAVTIVFDQFSLQMLCRIHSVHTASNSDHLHMKLIKTTHSSKLSYSHQHQTCQGPEMKRRETVRHSGEGAIFFRGGEDALPVMRPLSKFSNSCLHSCCRTEEIKFSIKPITRKPIQNLRLFYKIQNAISQTHVRIRYQCCQPRLY